MKYPPAMTRAVAAVTGEGPQDWAPYSEEYYWHLLLHEKPFSSMFAADGGAQPLIDAPDTNLSQTPREQCELDGYITEGKDRQGPGQEVILFGLVKAPDLNGRRGCVLPLKGRGAPDRPPEAGRVAVRLPGGRVVACRRANLRSPYAPAAAVEEASGGLEGQAGSGTSGNRLPAPTGPLVELVRADVERGSMPPRLTRANLRDAGMPEAYIRCSKCGDSSQPIYMALQRTAAPSHKPLPADAVKLSCVDCMIRAAQAARVPASAEAVGAFVDSQIMGSMEACSILMGFETTRWGGEMLGEGRLY